MPFDIVVKRNEKYDNYKNGFNKWTTKLLYKNRLKNLRDRYWRILVLNHFMKYFQRMKNSKLKYDEINHLRKNIRHIILEFTYNGLINGCF